MNGKDPATLNRDSVVFPGYNEGVLDALKEMRLDPIWERGFLDAMKGAVDPKKNWPYYLQGVRDYQLKRFTKLNDRLKDYLKDGPLDLGMLPMPVPAGVGGTLLPRLSPAVLAWAKRYGLNAASKGSQAILRNLEMKMSEWAPRFLKGRDWRKLDTFLEKSTVRDAY